MCSITRINKHSLALGLPFTFPGLRLCHNLFESHPRTPGDACVMAGQSMPTLTLGAAWFKDEGMVRLPTLGGDQAEES